jgi:lambda repressor-like predicted transcriptional regulator
LRDLCYSVGMKEKELNNEMEAHYAKMEKWAAELGPITPEEQHEWEQAQVEQVERFRDF